MSGRFRNWCFTLNNYTEEDESFIRHLEYNKQVKYLIVGKEKGEQGTPHLQGFIVYHNVKKFNEVKKFLGERYHIEQCQGSIEQNIAYCSKDDEYIELGERPKKKGARTDIEKVKEQIKNHVPIDEVINSATSYQSARHAELLFKYQSQPKPQKRTIKWYYGPTGTGKTRQAIEESEDNYYITMNTLKWWDGYTGQKYIIVDDFRKDFCTFHELLRILDRYPYRVNIKGSSLWLQPTTEYIIITSAYHPKDVYNTREDVEQLLRRIDKIEEFKST